MTPRLEDLVQLERSIAPRHVPLVLIGGVLLAVIAGALLAWMGSA